MNKNATHKYIDAAGHDVVLSTYAEGGKDEWEDATLVATDSTITAIRKMLPGDPSIDASGAMPTGMALFCVKDTVTVFDGGTTQASVITDDGVKWTVIAVDNQKIGMILVSTERMRP